MDNDFTRKTGLLSLADRARHGLLAYRPEWLPEQAELSLDDICWLEHTDSAARERLGQFIQREIDIGDLPICEGWRLSKEVYRAFRERCPAELLSPLSRIHKWLGAMPAVETLPPAEPSLPETTATTARPKPKTVLLTLLDEVDKRAAEQDAGFNRECLPGTKAEFQILALAFNHSAFSKALSTFSDYLDGHCQFSPGVKPEHGKGAVIWALFPEYDLKLG